MGHGVDGEAGHFAHVSVFGRCGYGAEGRDELLIFGRKFAGVQHADSGLEVKGGSRVEHEGGVTDVNGVGVGVGKDCSGLGFVFVAEVVPLFLGLFDFEVVSEVFAGGKQVSFHVGDFFVVGVLAVFAYHQSS